MSWFRRQRWALLAVVIAIPVAVLAAFSIRWPEYLAATQPHPKLLAEGDTGSYKHATFQLEDHQVIQADSAEGKELGALAGTEVVIVTLHVDATKIGKGIVGCTFQLVAPGPSGERTWGSDQTEVFLPYGDDSYKTFCILDDTAFELKQTFVVPSGTAKDVSLQFTPTSLEPAVLQWDW